MSATAIAVVLFLVPLVVGAVAFWRLRPSKRHPSLPTAELVPSTDPADDLAFPLYVELAAVEQLALTLNVALPREAQLSHTGNLNATAQGVGVSTTETTTVAYPGQINLAAFSRKLRRDVTDDRLAEDVLTVRRDATEDDARAKANQLAGIVNANAVMVLRGHLRLIEAYGDGCPKLLEFTHLSSETRLASTSRGHGDAAQLIMPEGLAIRVVMPESRSVTPAGRERLSQRQSLFCEVIAHTPSFEATTGIFDCAALAVWGCPGPETTDEVGA